MDRLSFKIDKIFKNKNLSHLMVLSNKQLILTKTHPKLSDKKPEWQEMQEVNSLTPLEIIY